MQNLASELPRIHLPRTSVNNPSLALFRQQFIGNSSPVVILPAVKLVERNEERNEGMRRTILLVAVVAGVLVLASGVALAANIVGNNAPNVLIGTQQADNIAGAARNDTIRGRGGDDRLFADSGNDELFGGDNADFLNAADGAGGDELNGGPGFDTCVRDPGDAVFINCNSVTTVP
jgi:hypothetical protein